MSAASPDSAELRQRQPHNAASAQEDIYTEHVTPVEEKSLKDVYPGDKGKKTYGRTPDGTGKLLSHPPPPRNLDCSLSSSIHSSHHS